MAGRCLTYEISKKKIINLYTDLEKKGRVFYTRFFEKFLSYVRARARFFRERQREREEMCKTRASESGIFREIFKC